MRIDEFRSRYPQYDQIPDDIVADAVWKKDYSNTDKTEFLKEFLSKPDPLPEVTIPEDTSAFAEPEPGPTDIPMQGPTAAQTYMQPAQEPTGIDYLNPNYYKTAAEEAGKSILRGSAGVNAFVYGAVPGAIGRLLGLESLERTGRKNAKGWEELEKNWQPDPSIEQDFTKDPATLVDLRYWMSNMPEVFTQVAAAATPALGVATGMRVMGKMYPLSHKLFQTLGTIGASIAGGAFGGGMEAHQVQKDVLQRELGKGRSLGEAKKSADAAGAKMFILSGVLNSLALGGMVKAAGVAGRGLAGLGNAFEEVMEGPAAALSKDEMHSLSDLAKSIRDEMAVAPTSFMMGFAGGGNIVKTENDRYQIASQVAEELDLLNAVDEMERIADKRKEMEEERAKGPEFDTTPETVIEEEAPTISDTDNIDQYRESLLGQKLTREDLDFLSDPTPENMELSKASRDVKEEVAEVGSEIGALDIEEEAREAPTQAETDITDTTLPVDDKTPQDPIRAQRKNAIVDQIEGEWEASITNEAVDAEREAMGLEPATHGERITQDEMREKALQRMDKDINAGRRLVDELNENPRAAEAEEVALLVAERVRLKHEKDMMSRELDEALESGDEQRIDEARRLNEIVDADLEIFHDAVTKTGTKSAQSLAMRKMLLREDWSLVSMEDKYKNAKGDKITEKERIEIKETQKQIADLDRQIEESEKDWQPRADEGIKKLKKTKKDKDVNPDSVIQKLQSELAEHGDFRIDRDAKDLARYYLGEGLRKTEEIVDAVTKDLQQVDETLTEKDIADAISDYGQFKELNKDEIEVELRRVRGELQQTGKIFDMLQKEPAKKTGQERREKTENERRLISIVDAMKREGDFKVDDPKTQIRPMLDSIKTRLRNTIQDLEYQIKTKKKIVKNKVKVLDDNESTALKKRVKELREEYNKVFGKKGLSDEQRLKIAKDAVWKQIFEYDRRIKENDFSDKKKRQVEDSELELFRMIRDSIKEEYESIKNPPKTEEEIAVQRYQSRLLTDIMSLSDKLYRGDFAKKETRMPTITDRTAELLTEREELKRKFNEGVLKMKLANRTKTQKTIDRAIETINLSQALMTSFDLSALGRQGIYLAASHPIIAARNTKKMIQAARSKVKGDKFLEEIRRHPKFSLMKQAGLAITEPGSDITKMEEEYMSRLIEKVPVARGSQRAYTTFLNGARADLFVKMVDSFDAITKEEVKSIADYVNNLTGRGGGDWGKTFTGLNTMFWAPRLVASRFKMLFGLASGGRGFGASKRVRRQIQKEYGKILGGLGLLYSLGMIAGGEGEDDPTSSDFGKLRFGESRVDVFGGALQALVFSARTALGRYTKQTGIQRPTRGQLTISDKKHGFNDPDALDVVGRFLRSKLRPISGTAANLIAQEDFLGKKLTMQESLTNLWTPLALKDAYKSMEEYGFPKGVILGSLAVAGIGLQVHDLDAKQKAWKIYQRNPTKEGLKQMYQYIKEHNKKVGRKSDEFITSGMKSNLKRRRKEFDSQ